MPGAGVWLARAFYFPSTYKHAYPMSYLALARKWRPRFFSDVAGQDHVVRALRNALESGRVHHAFLFAGTRGVGKTTIARILAKALNCEAMAGGEPCGECAACIGIDEGRFVDLLEVDAASRTKVDQTRELLENVQYTPTSGRCKIYLIDEVHMLSISSFNALLKTLEEPPPHVKFLLATTDPQKLPVTVLSRCLQFNLKRLPTALIGERMSYICEQEGIAAEPAALARVARAAAGSMRDGLSLLDQALVFGGGGLREADVVEMLGSMDPRHLREILQALVQGDAAGLMEQVKQLHEQVPDYAAVLDDFATLMQQIAVVQLAGAGALDEDADAAVVGEFAGSLEPEMVQLFYQMLITGRRDIALAPDPRIGFEMTLLRLLAFRPAGGGARLADMSEAAAPAAAAGSGKARAQAQAVANTAPVAPDADWPTLLAALPVTGGARELARNCAVAARSATAIELQVGASGHHLLLPQFTAELTRALQSTLGAKLEVVYSTADGVVGSVVDGEREQAAAAQSHAEAAIAANPALRQIIEQFDARVIGNSVKPVDPGTRH